MPLIPDKVQLMYLISFVQVGVIIVGLRKAEVPFQVDEVASDARLRAPIFAFGQRVDVDCIGQSWQFWVI